MPRNIKPRTTALHFKHSSQENFFKEKRKGTEDWWGHLSLTFINPEYPSSLSALISWLEGADEEALEYQTCF